MITALNGRLPAAERTVADTGPNGPQELRIDAAASWARMLAAGMPAGCLRSGYRTLAQQAGEYAANPKGALRPGESQHGEGLAADVDEPARPWIAAHGAPYGWRIGFVPGEPWHAQYDLTDTMQEDDMGTIEPGQWGTLNAKLDENKSDLAAVKAALDAIPDGVWRRGLTDPATGEQGPAEDRVTWMDRRIRDMTLTTIPALLGKIDGLTAALTQVAHGQPIDLAAVTAAAEAGARDALAGLTLKAQ